MVETLALMALLGLPCWYLVWRRPDLTPLLLLAWVALSGWLLARLGFSGPGKLLKDVLFVLPLYALVFFVRPQLLRGMAISSTLIACMILFAGLVILQIANPQASSLPVAILGAKVWLLYIPLALAAGAVLTEPAHLRRFLRGGVLVCLVVFGVALLQVVSSVAFGYQTAILLTHGDAARAATQGFVQFSAGGFYGRIPATFAFAGEFYGFCGAGLALSFAAYRYERAGPWKLLALVAVAAGCAAYVMSGSRGALLFIPLLFILFMAVERRGGSVFVFLAVTVPAVLAIADVADLDLIRLAGITADLTQTYGSQIGVLGTWEMMSEYPLGVGTGSGTGAARHLADAATQTPLFTYEGMYGKAAHELGLLGPFLLLALFATLIGAGLRALWQCRGSRVEGPAAALLAYTILMSMWSFKGWTLDLDPTNVLVWSLAGIVLRCPALVRDLPTAQPAGRHPFLASLRNEPTILGRPGGR
jgi:hypothetical protein